MVAGHLRGDDGIVQAVKMTLPDGYQVTRDTSGGYHFATVAAMPTTKRLDVLGGVAGAPAAMALTIIDAY